MTWLSSCLSSNGDWTHTRATDKLNCQHESSTVIRVIRIPQPGFPPFILCRNLHESSQPTLGFYRMEAIRSLYSNCWPPDRRYLACHRVHPLTHAVCRLQESIGLEEGWDKTHASILKIISIIEGGSTEDFPVADSSNAYTYTRAAARSIASRFGVAPGSCTGCAPRRTGTILKKCTIGTGSPSRSIWSRKCSLLSRNSKASKWWPPVDVRVECADCSVQLKELQQRWNNQRQMMRYLSNIFFKYLVRPTLHPPL